MKTAVVEPILDADGSPTAVVDFSQRVDPGSEFRRWCRDRCARPLAPGGKLTDSVLVRLGEGRTGWYLNQHHLVADAWSTQLLYRRVGAEYEDLLEEKDRERPSLRDLYYSTVAALPARSAERKSALEHWTARRERQGRAVPFYGRNGVPVGTPSSRLTLELDEDRSRALGRLSRQDGFLSLSEDLSRFSLFATLLVTWLHRISGQTDLGFDAPVAGRPTPEAKRALGLFIELFPFAATVEPQDTFRSLGARCLEEAKLFLRHALPGMSTPSGATASNIVLNYVPVQFGTFAGVPVEVEWVHPGHGDSVHALRLQVHDFAGSGRTTLHFDFNEGALPEPLRHRSLKHFEKVLDACLDDPDRPIASIDVLVDDERQALSALNMTKSPPLPDRSVVAMFRAQADLYPDRVALRQGALELSFAAVAEQSDALAASLVAAGRRAWRSGRDFQPAIHAGGHRHSRHAQSEGGLRPH